MEEEEEESVSSLYDILVAVPSMIIFRLFALMSSGNSARHGLVVVQCWGVAAERYEVWGGCCHQGFKHPEVEEYVGGL